LSSPRRLLLSPPSLRGLLRTLDRLTAPGSFGWIAPVLILGVGVIAVGWWLSLPVVLVGDGTYALGRAIALTARTLAAQTLPFDAPTPVPLVAWGIGTVAVGFVLAIVSVLLTLLRVSVDRYLITRARHLSLIYADPEVGYTSVRLAPVLATAVRLARSGRVNSIDDVEVPLDATFFAKVLPKCAGSVHELLALGSHTDQNRQLVRELIAQRPPSNGQRLERLCLRIDQRPIRSALGRDNFDGLVGCANELRFTSLPSARCRNLLREQPPLKVRTFGIGARPALVVIGLGDTGFELICKLVAQAQSPRLDPLSIVLVDVAAIGVEHALRSLSPQLESVVTFYSVSLEARLPEAAPHLLQKLAERGLTATCIYLAADESALVEGWQRELEFAYRVQGAGNPLVLGVRYPTSATPDYSLLAEDDALDAIPRQIHEDYLKRWRAQMWPSSPATVGWEDLPFDYQEDNRTVADHLWVKAREMDLHVGSGRSGPLPDTAPELLESLARAEHRRWIAGRAVAGWQYGPVREDAARVHPSMRSWEALDDKERAKDYEVVQGTASALESGGYGLRPLVRFSLARVQSRLDAAGYARVARTAIEQASASAPQGMPNVAICVDSPAALEWAKSLAAYPGVTVSVIITRSLAGFAVAAGDSAMAGQQLAEKAWELWVGPEAEIDALLARWPRLSWS
jgi:hypothetical protein